MKMPARRLSMRKYVAGVTLMELMIVVVIVGILAVVGYPNYRDFAARAKRTEAKAALLQIATNQERFYLNNNTYTNDLTNLGFPVAGTYTTDSGSYDVSIVAGANANSYTAIASFRLGGAEAGKCLTFTIDGAGARTSAPLADCWTRSR
ncbi:MAG: type IV pilin protein [Gammaproteobacteria bacterium]|nr:type IV pilin protein [Gammaproteobacteria bacterium]